MKRIVILLLSIFAITNVYSAYRISAKGKAFIKDKEKCVLTAYWDSNGYSIGYGHHSKDIQETDKITKAQADKYFEEDIAIAEKYANWLLKQLTYQYTFSQDFIDGFVSFVYNAGVGGVKQSIFYHHLTLCRVKNGVMNEEDYNFTLSKIKDSCIRCKGHLVRRQGEYDMMKGNYYSKG